MRIPKYWAKTTYAATDRNGETQKFIACGWSFTSLADAKQAALERAQRLFERITSGESLGAYEYLDRPIREEVIREIGEADALVAVITRNRYGALVLNAAQVMFIDVDFPRWRASGFLESIALAFSPAKRQAKRQVTIDATIQQVRGWAHRNHARSFRLYRTFDGLRLLFTDKLYDPNSFETNATMAELNADPMYVRLTQKQECFRARLTAKPWRCGLNRPPHPFPWESAAKEAEARQWEATYAEHDAEHKTCELIEQIGQIADTEAIRTVVQVHDQQCRIETAKPLA